MFGGGAGPAVMAALAGRLLCDTYISGGVIGSVACISSVQFLSVLMFSLSSTPCDTVHEHTCSW